VTVTCVDSDGSTLDLGSAQPNSSREEQVLSIELHTVATPVVIPTIRTVAADLAARADFDLDSIDDLRMAVDDVCALLVRIATLNAMLSCKFTVRAEQIELAAEVDADDSADPLPTRSFGWRVLESLADEVSARFLPGAQGQHARVRITLAKGAITAPQT
jgi:serine/threonine-protein kinase RsbW